MSVADEVARLTAVASPQRYRIIAELQAAPTHVSELARRVGMSRALLYMHLQRLEEAGLLAGRFELSQDGKALKIFEVVPFELRVSPDSIRAAVEAEPPTTATTESEQ